MKMQKNNIYKIILGFFLITMFIFTFLNYRAVNKLNPDIIVKIYFAGILISGIAMFIVGLLFKSEEKTEKNIITDDKNTDADTENESENKQKISEEEIQKEKKAKKIIDKSVSSILYKLNEVGTDKEFSKRLLKNLANEYAIVQGVVFLLDTDEGKYKLSSTYAIYTNEEIRSFKKGEGINGQVAANVEMLHIENIPENYITVLSGLGEGSPNEMLIFPIIIDQKAIGIVEIASFTKFPETIKPVYDIISTKLGEILGKI